MKIRIKVVSSLVVYNPERALSEEIMGMYFDGLLLKNQSVVIVPFDSTWLLSPGQYEIAKEDVKQNEPSAAGIIELFKTMKTAHIDFK